MSDDITESSQIVMAWREAMFTEHDIRLLQSSQAPSYDEEPEHKPRWCGLFLAGIAGACTLGIFGCLMMAWRALAS